MVDVSEVVVGSCFVTSNEQVRRVIEITVDGRVGYGARGKSFKLCEKAWHIGGPTRSNWPDQATFAAQVNRKVPCNWDPDLQRRLGQVHEAEATKLTKEQQCLLSL